MLKDLYFLNFYLFILESVLQEIWEEMGFSMWRIARVFKTKWVHLRKEYKKAVSTDLNLRPTGISGRWDWHWCVFKAPHEIHFSPRVEIFAKYQSWWKCSNSIREKQRFSMFKSIKYNTLVLGVEPIYQISDDFW